MNLDHFQVDQLARPLMAAERERLAAQRDRWARWWGARPAYWLALLAVSALALGSL